MRIINQYKNFRLIEIHDSYADIDNLKGDMFNPEANPEIPAEQLAREEREFEDLADEQGVYGYELQKWDSSVGIGWEHVDSCWGFIGQYNPADEVFNHYIIDELWSMALGQLMAGIKA